VPPEEAPDVVAGLREGRIPLPYLRGVAGLPPAAQAADLALREAHGLDRLDDLRWTGDLTFEAADGRRFGASVDHVPTGVERPVSCGPGAKREDPGRFDVVLTPAA
jgi:hypothetical protein